MLDKLSIDHRETIISLPYRVGFLVSQSDQTGGQAAHEQELETLANILDGFTQQVFGSELLQHVMAGTMDGRDQWTTWGGQLDSVYADCRKAVENLYSVADEKEVSAYKARLLEIAEAVAVAFREFEEMNFVEKISAYMAFMSAKSKSRKLGYSSYKTFDEFLNISMAERQVLEKLAAALGTHYI